MDDEHNESAPSTSRKPPRPPKGSIRQDYGLPTAPSIGPHTRIEHVPEDPAKSKATDTDAMGLDKRRQVIGGSYGPTKTRLVVTFGTAIGIIALVVVGFVLLAKQLDKAPSSNPDVAPWSAPSAPQHPPKPLQ